MKKKVVIGLSGGVDSSVAASILKDHGYEVIGLFMKNWHDTTGLLQSGCHWEDDLMFAEMVADRLHISFHMVDLSETYREKVVDYMFAEYRRGRTPNPDVLCNREIKFDSFAAEAEKLDAGMIATGHYCRLEMINTDNGLIYRLMSGKDHNKDQSYFLCQLSQKQLSKSLFPLGALTKPEVRKIADTLGLATATRKDSQGICFVGRVHLPTFLQQKLEPRKGAIIEIPCKEDLKYHETGLPSDNISDEELKSVSAPHSFDPSHGRHAGTHNGAHFFTTGQRKGMNTGGYKEPLFVLATDTEKNIIYAGEGQSHPGLYRKGLHIIKNEIHWIREDLEMAPGESREYLVRIRYRQPLQRAKLFSREDGIYIIFHDLQRGITPGQFAVWYDDDEVIGSGVINA